MNEHKQEIINTRVGCLGGSDAKMLMAIATNGFVPTSAYKRLAVCKGLIEMDEITTRVMEYGNFVEDCVFQNLKEINADWESNPCLVSEKYSRKNVKCIDHVDFFRIDKEKKVVILGECKASKYGTSKVRELYSAQLRHHYMLGKEIAQKLGYRVNVFLFHYSTEGINIDDDFVFDANRLNVVQIRNPRESPYDLAKAMDIVSEFLEGFNEYYEGDEVSANLLPEKVRNEFDAITNVLNEIKEREAIVADFKARLYEFMTKKEIKSIKCPEWSIARISPSESVQFDAKRFMADYAHEHPRKAKALARTYKKIVKRSGYANIKFNNPKD